MASAILREIRTYFATVAGVPLNHVEVELKKRSLISGSESLVIRVIVALPADRVLTAASHFAHLCSTPHEATQFFNPVADGAINVTRVDEQPYLPDGMASESAVATSATGEGAMVSIAVAGVAAGFIVALFALWRSRKRGMSPKIDSRRSTATMSTDVNATNVGTATIARQSKLRSSKVENDTSQSSAASASAKNACRNTNRRKSSHFDLPETARRSLSLLGSATRRGSKDATKTQRRLDLLRQHNERVAARITPEQPATSDPGEQRLPRGWGKDVLQTPGQSLRCGVTDAPTAESTFAAPTKQIADEHQPAVKPCDDGQQMVASDLEEMSGSGLKEVEYLALASTNPSMSPHKVLSSSTDSERERQASAVVQI